MVGALALACAQSAMAQGPLKPVQEPQVVAPDGQSIVFTTNKALTADDQDALPDVYRWSRGVVDHVSVGLTGGQADRVYPAGISDDGGRVLFESRQPLVPQDTDNDLDVYMRSAGQTRLVSSGPTDPGLGVGDVWRVLASADLSLVYFMTKGPMVAADTDAMSDIYVWDAATGETSLVSTTPSGVAPGTHILEGLSRDGTRIFEDTDEALVPQDTNGVDDVYERHAGAATLLSQGTTTDSTPQGSEFVHATPDGQSVVFRTPDQLDSHDLDNGVDLYQRAGGRTRLLSVNSQGLSLPCAQGDPLGGSRVPPCYPEMLAESDDGGHVLFTTDEPLTVGDTNGAWDVYDAGSSSPTLLTSSPTAGGSGVSAAISSDGARAIVQSSARFSGQDTDTADDIYAWQGGAATLASPGPGAQVNLLGASRDARTVFFETTDPLAPQDTNGGSDFYVNSGGRPRLVTAGPPADTLSFEDYVVGMSDDGSRLFLMTRRPMVAADTDTAGDLYLWSRGRLTLIT